MVSFGYAPQQRPEQDCLRNQMAGSTARPNPVLFTLNRSWKSKERPARIRLIVTEHGLNLNWHCVDRGSPKKHWSHGMQHGSTTVIWLYRLHVLFQKNNGFIRRSRGLWRNNIVVSQLAERIPALTTKKEPGPVLAKIVIIFHERNAIAIRRGWTSSCRRNFGSRSGCLEPGQVLRSQCQNWNDLLNSILSQNNCVTGTHNFGRISVTGFSLISCNICFKRQVSRFSENL